MQLKGRMLNEAKNISLTFNELECWLLFSSAARAPYWYYQENYAKKLGFEKFISYVNDW